MLTADRPWPDTDALWCELGGRPHVGLLLENDPQPRERWASIYWRGIVAGLYRNGLTVGRHPTYGGGLTLRAGVH